MYYFYEVAYYDEFDNITKNEGGLLKADNYTHAMEMLVLHYGEKELTRIELLEPFTDNSVVILDTIAKRHIELVDMNGF